MFAAIRLSSLANNDDAPTTTSQDPFWHATPRTLTSRGDFASGNAAMPKVSVQPQNPTSSPPPPPPLSCHCQYRDYDPYSVNISNDHDWRSEIAHTTIF